MEAQNSKDYCSGVPDEWLEETKGTEGRHHNCYESDRWERDEDGVYKHKPSRSDKLLGYAAKTIGLIIASILLGAVCIAIGKAGFVDSISFALVSVAILATVTGWLERDRQPKGCLVAWCIIWLTVVISVIIYEARH